MSKRTTLKIDLAKINPERIRKYERKDGTVVKEYSIDFVELDSTKVITKADGTPISGDGWRLEKVGFACDTPTKEERTKAKENDTYASTEILGNAERIVSFEPPNDDSYQARPSKSEDDVISGDIPF